MVHASRHIERESARDSRVITMSTNSTDRQLVWIVLALLALVVVLPTLGMGFGMMGGGPMGGGWGMGHMWDGDGTAPTWLFVLGAVMQLAFLAVLVAAGYLGYRALVRRDGGDDRAIQELRTAYARGDLSDEEFERRRERLERDRE